MKLLKKLRKNYCKRSDLDKIMYGNNSAYSMDLIPIFWILLAMVRYKKAMFIFEKEGLKGILGYVQQKIRMSRTNITDVKKLQSIRRYMVLFRFMGKIYHENWNCLAQACSLFVALYTLGFDIDLVIGNFIYCASQNFDFHAWVEICGEPINDKRSVYERCVVIYRYSSAEVGAKILRKSINDRFLL